MSNAVPQYPIQPILPSRSALFMRFGPNRFGMRLFAGTDISPTILAPSKAIVQQADTSIVTSAYIRSSNMTAPAGRGITHRMVCLTRDGDRRRPVVTYDSNPLGSAPDTWVTSQFADWTRIVFVQQIPVGTPVDFIDSQWWFIGGGTIDITDLSFRNHYRERVTITIGAGSYTGMQRFDDGTSVKYFQELNTQPMRVRPGQWVSITASGVISAAYTGGTSSLGLWTPKFRFRRSDGNGYVFKVASQAGIFDRSLSNYEYVGSTGFTAEHAFDQVTLIAEVHDNNFSNITAASFSTLGLTAEIVVEHE